jgi:hypothetical protein
MRGSVTECDIILIIADVILIYLAGSMKNIIDETAWTAILAFRLVPTNVKVPETAQDQFYQVLGVLGCSGVPSGSSRTVPHAS